MTLSKYLEVHSLTQAQFAKILGKSQQLISGYCSGELIAPRATALKIIKVTNCEVTLEDLWGIKIA